VHELDISGMSQTTSYASPRRDRRGAVGRNRGFTLLEAMLTMVIIGIGVTATLQLLAAGTTCNIEAAQSTMAVNLARNVRELTLKLPYADVRAMNGQTFDTPVDSRGEQIEGFEGWSQRVVVQPVSFDGLTTNTVEADPEAVRVTVEVVYNGAPVGEARWYRFKPGAS
jgi:prepilin-type N-terminal cleavage/methylation domain-containing protein